MSTTPRETTNPLFMVQRGGDKFILTEGDPPQLYDVVADPEELVNLTPERGSDVAAVEAEIADRWDTRQLRDQVLLSQHRRAFVSRVMSAQGVDWDYTPVSTARASTSVARCRLVNSKTGRGFPPV